MVEPTSSPAQTTSHLIELKNQRRVCRSLTAFTDKTNQAYLLAADMMHAHTNMDGQFKVLSLTALLAQA